MRTVTADDIRVLARSAAADAVLARVGDDIRVLPDDDGSPDGVAADEILYTKARLVAEYGDEITDVEAEVLAAGLRQNAEPSVVPDTDVAPEAGTIEPPD